MKHLVLCALLLAGPVLAAPITVTPRDMKAISLFKKTVPCPATGKIVGAHGSCAGYVVDHGLPKCAGGKDEQYNLFWQEKAASFKKDRAERELCRILKAAGLTDSAATD